MKSGMWIAILGILGIIVGGLMYVEDYHRTIGLGGVGLGIVLLAAGGAMSMRKGKTTAATVPSPS